MKSRLFSYCSMAAGPFLRSLLVVVLSALMMTGCATTGGGEAKSDVVERAEKRWAALLEGDYAAAYDYYSPGFRSSQSVGDFELSMRLRKVQFSEVEYESHQCDQDRCNLKFEVGYRAASPVPGIEVWEGKTSLEETWIKTNGQWWYLPND